MEAVLWSWMLRMLWLRLASRVAEVLSAEWGGQCVSVWFFDVACVKTFKIQHCDSSGEHIYTKIVEEKGPGW